MVVLVMVVVMVVLIVAEEEVEEEAVAAHLPVVLAVVVAVVSVSVGAVVAFTVPIAATGRLVVTMMSGSAIAVGSRGVVVMGSLAGPAHFVASIVVKLRELLPLGAGLTRRQVTLLELLRELPLHLRQLGVTAEYKIEYRSDGVLIMFD